MARKNQRKLLCPFKKAVTKEYNPQTGKVILRERFEPCAGPRCTAYYDTGGNDCFGTGCRRLDWK